MIDSTLRQNLLNSIENKGFFWSHKSLLLLLDIYKKEKENFPEYLPKNKLWLDISKVMNKEGYEVDGVTCDRKFRNMMATYQKIKDNCRTGRGKKLGFILIFFKKYFLKILYFLQLQ